MVQNPKYDGDLVNLGYLKKRLLEVSKQIEDEKSSTDNPIKNYSAPPVPPYYKGSMLCYNHKIYQCRTTREIGAFSWDDWFIVATDDEAINEFIDNVYEVEKIQIQEQIDNKIESYYQQNDPALAWPTDLEKAKHIGDYWYNTTDNTQWRYNSNTTTTPITYGWQQVNVPNAVFDLIDAKKSIYSNKPTSYHKDDLWIIEDSISDADLPVGTEENPIVRGDWVFSNADSNTYDKNHWEKRDENVNIEYIEQHYYTKGATDSLFEEVERNTDSKITQAKNEINLQVAEEYTTKEEHNTAILDFEEQVGTINQTIETQGESIAQISVENQAIRESVETNTTQIETIEIQTNNNYQEIIEKFDNYATAENVTEVSNKVDTLQTSTDYNISVIEDIQENGVSKIHTETGYTFDGDGLHIDKTDSPVASELDEAGLEIEDKTGAEHETQFYGGYVTDEMAEKTPELEKFKGQTATYSKNILFKQFLMSENWRIEETLDDEHGIGLGFFYVGE